MPEPFVPEKPDEKVAVTIFRREAVLLQKLRRYPFGEIVVYKANNTLTRIKVTDSQMIDPTTEVDLDG